jgi:hypothetical protein
MSALLPEANDRLIPPWRFRLGDVVYVRGRSQDSTFKIIGGELWMGCPHLTVLDLDGKAWRVAQIECSSKPISFQKG